MSQRILIRGGYVLRLEDGASDLPQGDILVEGGKIAAVGRNVAAEGAEVIDASGMLVLPGFVDTHRHTWQTMLRHRGGDWSLHDYFVNIFTRVGPRVRPEDVYAGTLFGALGALDAGITTLLDWSHIQNSPAHSDAAIDALGDAGLRAVFGHGWSLAAPAPGEAEEPLHPSDLRRIRRERLSSDDGLVTLAMAARGPDFTSDAVTASDFAMARDLGLRLTVHVAAAEGSAPSRGIERMHAAGLLGPDLTLVHVANATDEALRLMVDHGVTASVAPQIELAMSGLATPVIARMMAAGVRPSLSVDSETSASGDMFTQMRAALAAHHALRTHASARGVQGGKEVAYAPLSAREVLRWATLEGVRATGLERRTGSLSPGKDADIVLVRANDANLFPTSAPADALVLAAHAGNVDTVLVQGQMRKRGGRLLADLDRARTLVKASLTYLTDSPAFGGGGFDR
ncbi:MAG TPA: amidohydrolase family protein [Polyangiaceae bacterium]|nr:amidohydrolase family protein [Polyangiaceae bacterium]